MPKLAFLSSKRLPNMTKSLKGSKSVHASDESCHIMYVTETKILSATILAILFTFGYT